MPFSLIIISNESGGMGRCVGKQGRGGIGRRGSPGRIEIGQGAGPVQAGGDQGMVIPAAAEGLPLWTVQLLRERCSLTLTLRRGGVAGLQAVSPPSFSTSASYGKGRRNAAIAEGDRAWPLPICCHICTLPGT